MSISIIIPVYNSESSLKPLYTAIKQLNIAAEIIFVNDCSTDQSLKVLKELLIDENIKIIDLQKNYGQQYAIFVGLERATGDYLVTMDDDLQHPVSLILEMQEKIDEGADLVYGIPVNQHSGYRQLGSKLTAVFFRRFFKNLKGKKVSSYRMFRRELRDQIEMRYQFVYISALLLPKCQTIENIHFDSIKRPYGRSGYNYKKLLMLFIKLFFYFGPRILEAFRPKLKKREERIIYEKNHDTWCRPMSN